MLAHLPFKKRIYYALKLRAGIGEGEQIKGWFWIVAVLHNPKVAWGYFLGKLCGWEVDFASQNVRIMGKWYTMKYIEEMQK